MLRRPVEDIIREEIDTVRARRIILDQLEGGLMTGAELREKITTDVKAKMVAEGASKRDIAKVKVTSPKLYHNTRRLEDLGIIVSWKQSQYRLYELDPHAILPVRRVLGISKPLMYITSLSNPEDQRPFVQWLVNNPYYNPKKLLVFVEATRWTRGISRIMDRFIPDDAFRVWTTEWKEVPEEVTGGEEEPGYGNLQKTFEFLENEILKHLQSHNMIFDLTLGPTLITLAMAKLANEYSTIAFQVSRYNVEDAEISYY
ncbi:MAG: helix-turn-helix domain-containing protein [Candidatus Thorarchaeota archaeon]|jgi:DNA-binding transcriptional ArsR family regulator